MGAAQASFHGSLEHWTGTWTVEKLEGWAPFLELAGVAPAEVADHEAKLVGRLVHRYRVDAAGYTLECLSDQQPESLYRGDLDAELRSDSRYVDPAGASWADCRVRHSWVEEPVCFRTELPDYKGRAGTTVTIERRLLSPTQLLITVQAQEGDQAKLGPCRMLLRRDGAQGPAPVAFLRARGRPLKTAAQRKEALAQVAKMIAENIDAFSAVQEKDRIFPSKFNGVAQMVLNGCQHYQGLVDEWAAPEVVQDLCPAPLKAGVDADWTVVNEPKGVCINVSPWNAPIQLSVMPVMAMLAAGNRCVIKPPDLVPNVSALVRRLCHQYLDGYVWVEEGGKEAVERLIDEGADHLAFTGGGEIAKVVAARCAKMLTPVTLELGGKSPVFIDKSLNDGMLQSAVREILETKVAKTGQFCCAHDYALVHEAMFDRFSAEFQAQVEALGDRRNIGIVARRHYNELKKKLEEAGAADVIPPMGGPFVPNDAEMTLPMVGLVEPAPGSSVLNAEIFGPLLPIVKVRDVEGAIEKVNRMVTGKPLIAYCYSEDPSAVDLFVSETSSGNVAVNGGPQRMISNFACTFGGVGPSGTGASFWGRESLKEFSNRKYVMRARGGFAKSFFSGPPPPAAPSAQ